MRALTWQGKEKVSVETVPDPVISQPTDAIIKVTSTAICGSDLHLYSVLGPYLHPGDILGHEPMGIVEEVGAEVTHIKPGDRVVVPFNISCGSCWMCSRGLFAQCETTQIPRAGQGRLALRLHRALRLGAGRPGGVPAGAPGPLRADQGARRRPGRALPLPLGHPAHRLAGRGLRRRAGGGARWRCSASAPWASSAPASAAHQGRRVIGVDRVPERLALARQHGVETVDLSEPRRRRRGDPRADRRPRCRRGGRRGRDGGARQPGGGDRHQGRRAPARRRWPSR